MRLNRTAELKRVPLAVALLAFIWVAFSASEAGADFTFTLQDPMRVGPGGLDPVSFKFAVTNYGVALDRYDILRIRNDLPSGWNTSICRSGSIGDCYAPSVDSVYAGPEDPTCEFPHCAEFSNYDLNPGEMDTISCYLTPSDPSGTGPEGTGFVTFRVRSVSNPTQWVHDVRLGYVTDGVDVLLMDDDGGAALESYYEAAIPGGTEQGIWDRSLEAATGADLLNFPNVVWFTGSATPTLDANDRTAINGYLAGTGRLLLSGQDIAFDLCDPGSPNYSAANVTWYETNLNTRYLNNNSASLSVNGVAGDPISNGLNLALSGGTGANNQTDPDVLQRIVGSGTAWTYAVGGGTAATRINGFGYAAVNLGFGFEAISTSTDRSTAMTNILNWLGSGVNGVDDEPVAAAPAAFTLGPVRPNPFASPTAIPFELMGAGVVRLRIIDSAGRIVRVLAESALPAGRHVRDWDGRDAQGRLLAAGFYVAELSVAGSGSQRVKLVVLR